MQCYDYRLVVFASCLNGVVKDHYVKNVHMAVALAWSSVRKSPFKACFVSHMYVVPQHDVGEKLHYWEVLMASRDVFLTSRKL